VAEKRNHERNERHERKERERKKQVASGVYTSTKR